MLRLRNKESLGEEAAWEWEKTIGVIQIVFSEYTLRSLRSYEAKLGFELSFAAGLASDTWCPKRLTTEKIFVYDLPLISSLARRGNTKPWFTRWSAGVVWACKNHWLFKYLLFCLESYFSDSLYIYSTLKTWISFSITSRLLRIDLLINRINIQ